MQGRKKCHLLNQKFSNTLTYIRHKDVFFSEFYFCNTSEFDTDIYCLKENKENSKGILSGFAFI